MAIDVALYNISAWEATNVQRDVKAFRAYQAWQENPSRHRDLGQKLLRYTKVGDFLNEE